MGSCVVDCRPRPEIAMMNKAPEESAISWHLDGALRSAGLALATGEHPPSTGRLP